MNNLLSFIASSPSFPKAVCTKVEDPNIFFIDDKRVLEKKLPELKSLCMSCVHRIECRDFALAEQIEFGFWGGLSPAERQKLMPKKKRRKRRSLLGFKAAQLRAEGLRWSEIASELSTTPRAAQKAWERYMQDQRNAS